MKYDIRTYDSRNPCYREIVLGEDEEGNYIEVQKSDGYTGTDARRQTKLVVTVYDGSQPGQTPYPRFNVNGTEFSDAADFTVSLFDYVDASEEAEVHIPQHTETEVPLTPSGVVVIVGYRWYGLALFARSATTLMDNR
jgi:hypothetical protein